ncbi:DUF2306 domain-containing protein [Roseomonas sp. GC11]|uniref:DUF2306 domain-containing protein n=1 Tax=Roseomonas sp. GC11 TaxID=2950546 RepID=UPI0021092E09|nr:DUF2306 domain-containing protein [Roseomonas sp. GC11]MCQ4159540.1 DUF2306 domain-containing protein [Roseomonas sp. GC11]
MSLAPLLAAPVLVQAHAAAAMAAFLLGLAQFARRKGGGAHRGLGYAWVGLMLATALTSFGITGVGGAGHYSWIHILSVVVLISAPLGVLAARRGDIRRHRIHMITLFAMALVVTGGFTLLPGRVMHQVVFGAG